MSSFGYDLLGFGSSANTAVDLPSDDEFNRVSFLSHFDGANNGVNNSFDDGSADNRTITTAGNMTQGSFGPFARPDGEWGVALDGSDGIKTPASGVVDFGTGDFTIEAFFNSNVVDSSNDTIIQNWGGGTGNPVGLAVNRGSTGGIQFYIGSSLILDTGANAFSANTWNHLAVARSGTSLKMFVNGSVEVTATNSGNITVGNSNVSVGYDVQGTNNYFNGSLSNVRIVKGAAVYTSAFTPTTAPLTAITNTQLLTCQSNRFVDNSASARTLTPSGNASVSAFGPFLTTSVYDPALNAASAYFNASSAILVASPPSFGPQSWTFECWFYFTGDGGHKKLLAQGPANGTDVSEFYCAANDKLTFQVATSGVNRIIMSTTAGDIRNNEWVHCALTHLYTSSSNSTYKIYQNGILGQTLNHTGGYNWSSGAGSGRPIVIGRSEWEGNYNSVPMYVQDSRLVVGSVVYTGNFTPPTAPLTAITNTKLLLNMQDAQAIDSAAQLNVELGGDPKISNAKAKFGDTSLLFGGSGRVYLRGRVLDFGSGDFTVEMFVNVTAFSSSYPTLIDARNSNDAEGPMFSLFLNDDDKFAYFVDNSTRITAGSAASANTWYHVAVCRSGTSTKLFIDGTQAGSTYSDSTVYTQPNDHCILGGYYNSVDYDFDGYIDEVRISKMARYTNNFTAPTAPFADKGQ